MGLGTRQARREKPALGFLGWVGCLLMNHLRLWGGTSKSRVFWDRLGQTSEISFLNSASHWCCLTPPAERGGGEKKAQEEEWKSLSFQCILLVAQQAQEKAFPSLRFLQSTVPAPAAAAVAKGIGDLLRDKSVWTQQDHHRFNLLTLCCHLGLKLKLRLILPNCRPGVPDSVSRNQQHLPGAIQRTWSEVLDCEQCHDWL